MIEITPKVTKARQTSTFNMDFVFSVGWSSLHKD